MSQNVAEAVIAILEAAGVKRCYGIPGDSLNYVTEAMRKSTIRFVHMRHEEAGGFAAGGESYLTGELSMCAGSCGPGSLHFLNGLADANRSGAPVVLLASQIASEEIGTGFVQEVDFKALYRPFSVFCEEIRTASQAERMTVMAAQAALRHKGVAVLILPIDISKASLKPNPKYRVQHARPVIRPNDDELDRIADLLNAEGTVTIYGGWGCHSAHDRVVALAEKLRAPVVHTSRAKDFLQYDNPYDVGMTGMFGNEGAYHAVKNCDTLLLLGCNMAWSQFYPTKATVIQIDQDAAHLGRRSAIDIGVIGDIAPTLDALLPRIRERSDESFLTLSRENARRAIESQAKHVVADDNTAIHPPYLFDLVGRKAAADAIITADNGSPMLWASRHMQANGSNRTIISLTHGTMANAMPQAFGAKAAFPDRQVIAMCGDGGFSMMMGDILTAVQESLPIKVCVSNNGALGFVSVEQKAEGFLDTYVDLTNPDFSRIAAAAGWWGRRVEKASDLEDAVAQWLAEPGPALLDVVTDHYEVFMPPVVKLENVLGMALYSTSAILAGRGRDVKALVKNVIL